MIGRLGVPELVVILILVLLVFGPSRLPKIAKAAGDGVRQLRKIRREVDDAVDDVTKSVR